jgi:sugar lactone lactonase YvrE
LYRTVLILLATAVAAAPSSAAPPQQPTVIQPYDLQPLANGKVLVTDLPANAVYELDPARKAGRLVARIAQARELVLLKDGRVLVSSGLNVLALNPRTGRTTRYASANDYLLGIALAPDGWLYGSENSIGSEQTTLVRIRAGKREVLGEFHGVHGILPVADGLILSESYGGRVLHVDPERKEVRVLATGLKNPSVTVPASNGGWFVSEFFGARVDHLWPDGHITKVAPVFKPGAIAYDSRHRLIGITQSGRTLFRVVRGRAVTIYP